MKKFIQVAVGLAVTAALAPLTFGTPFNHWMVFAPILIGTMFIVALVQHWLDHRRPR